MGGGAWASAWRVNHYTTITIRVANAADLDAIHAIEVASFGEPWRRESFRSYLLDGRARIVVAADAGGAISGFAVLLVAADEAEVANVAVSPAARRKGVGCALTAHVLAVAREGGAHAVFLEVRESNTAARAMYAGLGFSEVGNRRAYYRHPDENAVIMRWGVAVAWHRSQPIGDAPRAL